MSSRRRRRTARKSGRTAFLIGFIVLWSAFIAVFDVLLGSALWDQSRTASFSHTRGVVTHSEIESKSTSDGTTYSADIHFRYSVNGVEHTQDQYRAFMSSSSDYARAEEAVRRFPVDAEVDVFYDPAAPQQAVLDKGLDGHDRFFVLFLFPFHVVPFFLGALILGGRRRRREFPESGGIAVQRHAASGLVAYRLAVLGPWAVGWIGLLVASFLGIFAVGLGSSMDVSSAALQLAFGGAALVGFGTGLARGVMLRSGRCDLVIDAEGQFVALPFRFLRRSRDILPAECLRALRVRRVVTRSSKGGRSVSYTLTLTWATERGEQEDRQLKRLDDLENIHALAWALHRDLVAIGAPLGDAPLASDESEPDRPVPRP